MAWMLDDSNSKKGKKKKKSKRSNHLPWIGVGLLILIVVGSVIFAVAQSIRTSTPSGTSAPEMNATSTMKISDANATNIANQATAGTTRQSPVPTSQQIIVRTLVPTPANTPNTSPVQVGGDQEFIASANANTSQKDSMRFDFNLSIRTSDESESAKIELQGSGNVTGITDFNNFHGQLVVNKGTITIPNSQPMEFNFELRAVNGSMYMRAESPTTCKGTRWLETTIEDAIKSVTLINPGGGIDLAPGSFDPSDLNLNQSDAKAFEDILGLLSFGSYVQTQRQPDNNGRATFMYTIDLPGFLQSDGFFNFLGSFGKFGGPQIPSDQLTALKPMMSSLLSQILVYFSLKTYQEIDISSQLNTGYRLDLETDLNTGAISGNSTVHAIHLEVDFQVSVADHGGVFPVDVPPDAIHMTGMPDPNKLPPEAFISCTP